MNIKKLKQMSLQITLYEKIRWSIMIALFLFIALIGFWKMTLFVFLAVCIIEYNTFSLKFINTELKNINDIMEQTLEKLNNPKE